MTKPTAWEKSPPELVELFESVVPDPPVESRKMFGYPACFLNGNMFMGLHEHRFILRLRDADRDEITRREGAEPFEPMPGRAMKEYVVVPASVLQNKRKLNGWVAKALAYVQTIPPKAKKKK